MNKYVVVVVIGNYVIAVKFVLLSFAIACIYKVARVHLSRVFLIFLAFSMNIKSLRNLVSWLRFVDKMAIDVESRIVNRIKIFLLN
jgi:hypothetical protein